jgi:hypothetical protein
MKYKYMRYTIKGEKSAAEAQSAIGEAASQGVIVRVEASGGQTQVYIATPDTGGAGGAKPQSAATTGAKAKQSGGVKGEEVSEADVTKIG